MQLPVQPNKKKAEQTEKLNILLRPKREGRTQCNYSNWRRRQANRGSCDLPEQKVINVTTLGTSGWAGTN